MHTYTHNTHVHNYCRGLRFTGDQQCLLHGSPCAGMELEALQDQEKAISAHHTTSVTGEEVRCGEAELVIIILIQWDPQQGHLSNQDSFLRSQYYYFCVQIKSTSEIRTPL